MKKTIVRRFIPIVAALGAGFLVSTAQAELISTDRVASPPAQSERERVKALLARPEVAQQLETLGVLSKDAQTRVDALSDAEVIALANRIDALPAGGFTDQNWLLVIIAILLVILIL